MTEFERIAAATGITDRSTDKELSDRLDAMKVDGLYVVAVIRQRDLAGRVTAGTFYSARTLEEAQAASVAEDRNV